MSSGDHPSNAGGEAPTIIADQFSAPSVSISEVEAGVKDPRKSARKYQTDLCKKALEENIIVYLGTGCGKTHIAVLLIYEMSHLIKKPEKNICVFLAPTVALVEQQARVIQESIDFKVGIFCGSSKHLKTHHEWEKEMEEYEVLVMTPQILLHNLSHCFIRIELIALLIFDECHYAQLESNHPYAEIMKVFYKPDAVKLPRIFGMTASPKFGKGASINSLETLLHAKVHSVEDKEELEQFVASPEVRIYYYHAASNSSDSPHTIYSKKLEDIKYQCVSMLRKKADDHTTLNNIKKTLQRLHGNLMFCLENLGLWGALQASRILLRGDHFERSEIIEAEEHCNDDSLYERYLAQVDSVFASDCMKVQVDGAEADLSSVEVLKEPFFSKKLLRLICILSKFRLQQDMKCIVFVNRIVTARSLSYILRNLKFLSSWKCNFLVGVHSGLKSMSKKTTNNILKKFRSGELNLLIATKVGEEGLDIQTCCLVIRFDLPETVASFIQSRGRARMPQSEYAFLVNSDNEKERNLIENFKKDEDQMNDEIVSRTSSSTFVDSEERTYKVDSTGAEISAVTSISLLHHYCSKLPHDEYFNPRPKLFYFDDADGTICHIILPANAPIHQIVSSPQSSMEDAKKDACLKACKELHQVGALTDYLLPDQEDEIVGLEEDAFDSDGCDGQGLRIMKTGDVNSRRELHEMLVPATLKEPWNEENNTVCLYSYFIKFSPTPPDRTYKDFGLFVKATLPQEAERMELELHLARGRLVKTELDPSGVVKFDKDEIMLAEKIQEMFLKAILDRSEFIPEFVSLGKSDFSNSSSLTYYLMLPVVFLENGSQMTVDWNLVRRCLSSPIFGVPEYTNEHMNNYLHLCNGRKSVEDVENSLVYVQCKNTFFFVSEIVKNKNGYCTYKDSMNHVDHYLDMFHFHLLYPEQPLLKAKQLFCMDNLLRKKGNSELREKEEHFVELPPEICQLKIIGFSKEIGSSLSLLPSIMRRLESLLVAVELKHRLSSSFPEGAEVTAYRVLEALTTEKCNEQFSLERLEVLGDAFLKFTVGRHLFLLHDALDEGQLTRRRSNLVNNSNLFKLATAKNLQVYIRDQPFDPSQFFAVGRPCPVICGKETETGIHPPQESSLENGANTEVSCNKNHHWLHKKTIADVVEALVGAFIVDSGFKAAIAFLKWIGINVDFKDLQVHNICSTSSIFIPLMSHVDTFSRMDTDKLENLLGYQFIHKGLLVQAFELLIDIYQRLEFLGDAVLDYLITSYLYSVYPNLKPGQLTDLRSVSVNNNSFADVAVHRSFHEFIICESSSLCESMNKYVHFLATPTSERGPVEAPCPKVLGDLVESCVGAILLDTGFDLRRVWEIALSFFDRILSFSRMQINPTRELRELCQTNSLVLKFTALKKGGTFSVDAEVKGKSFSIPASASNINKEAAKRMAAKELYSKLKAQGYKSKSKSLEEVLRTSPKMEAKLIGFDETPTPAIAPSNMVGSSAMKEPSRSRPEPKFRPIPLQYKKDRNRSVKSMGQPSSSCESQGIQNSEGVENNSQNGDLQTSGGLSKVTAKARLYELCAANYWKPPLFEVWKESGPSHLREYIMKVVVVVEEGENTMLECFGGPRPRKKDAAEHAAEGALWYLKHHGYLLD
ncbi:hypothetical protein LguiA_018756 [Lonicera macranthoides]